METEMPAKSKKQQMAMSIALHNPSKLMAKNKGMLKMSKSQLSDFASTSRKGLPKVSKKRKEDMQFMSRMKGGM